jgi:hypothetical protein
VSAHESLAGSEPSASPRAIARFVRELTARQAQFLLAGSVLCAAALLTRRLDHGWFHHDDGSLAHSAERILAGELPHRDFADLYTGLLSFLNAAVFAVAGEDIFNLRIPLFGLFLVFAACFYGVARRLVSPIWAFVATLFAIAWSVPVYPAPMPSWYLLFLSTIGMYAVVRFFETDAKRWLFLAGACGGISIAIKIVGVWYVIAVVLALLLRPLMDESASRSQGPRSTRYAALVTSFAFLALAFAVAVVSGGIGDGEVVGLLLPVTALCAAAALVGSRAALTERRADAASLRAVATFVVGVVAPIAALVTPYAVTGSIGDLVEGVLVSPQSRFEFASFDMPHPATLLWAVPVVTLFVVRRRLTDRWRNRVDVAAGTFMVFLAVTATRPSSYGVIWNTTRALAPFVIVLGAIAIFRHATQTGRQPHVVALVVLVGGFSTLLQFPFAAPVYFCYVAPLVLLAAIAAMRSLGLAKGLLPGVVLIALVVFGVRQLDQQSVLTLGFAYEADPGVTIIDGDRASIRAHPYIKQTYDAVRETVGEHSVAGDPIFAGPDAPEIYYLTGARNPTPSVMDFLDSSGTTRGDRLLRLLREANIRVVVLNHEPLQSPRLAATTIDLIRSRYEGSERVGPFEVRWIANG